MEVVKLNAVDIISGKPEFDKTNLPYKTIFCGITVLAKPCPAFSRRKKKF